MVDTRNRDKMKLQGVIGCVKSFKKRFYRKSQSAMEYLMTYGWSILIIAVVLGALSFLGIFNPLTFAPKASPGNCQVVKNTQLGVSNLVGSCNNQIPQYVAYFNGKGAYANLGNNPSLSPEAGTNGAMTFCMWYRINSLSGYAGPVLKGAYPPSNGNYWEYTFDQGGSSEGFTVWTAGGATLASAASDYYSFSYLLNQWIFACFTYDYPAGLSYYYVGYPGYSAPISFNSPISGGVASQGTGFLILGAGEGGYSNVSISNVQMYNASLSSSAVNSLYQEGIGGAPINLQNLVGWWPLDGNANDYSGNNYYGITTNVIFTNSWTHGYTQP